MLFSPVGATAPSSSSNKVHSIGATSNGSGSSSNNNTISKHTNQINDSHQIHDNNNNSNCGNLNNNPNKQSYSLLERKTVSQISSSIRVDNNRVGKNVGSLTQLRQQQPVPSTTTTAATATTIHINITANANTSHLPIIGNRQAISMEQLNTIQHQHNHHLLSNQSTQGTAAISNQRNHYSSNNNHHHLMKTNKRLVEANTIANGGGSLSSGGSSSSLDDSSDERKLHQASERGSLRASATTSGLTRSASRVSRFKSAKEFFERLSSINNNNSIPTSSSSTSTLNRLSEKPPLPDRPRGNVVIRYTGAVAAKVSSHANLTNLLQHQNMNPTNASSQFFNSPRSHQSPLSQTLNQASPIQNTIAVAIAAAAALPVAPPVERTSLQSEQDCSPQGKQQQKDANLETSQGQVATKAIVNSSQIATTPTTLATAKQASGLKIPTSNLINNIIKDLEQQSLSSYSSNSSSDRNSSGSLNCDDSPPQSPKSSHSESDIVCNFSGDNVVVNNGSLLVRRNKQLNIKFDENSAPTFEYPSEEAMLAEPESPVEAALVGQQEQQQQQVISGAGEQEESQDLSDSLTTLAGSASTSDSQAPSNLGAKPTSNYIRTSPLNNIALSNYKPSTLLVEIPDNNNIDDKLGVKNLVTTAASLSVGSNRLPVPLPKSRTTSGADLCSANNGTIIYAQSNNLKNSFNMTTFTGGNANGSNDKPFARESQQAKMMMLNGCNGNSRLNGSSGVAVQYSSNRRNEAKLSSGTGNRETSNVNNENNLLSNTIKAPLNNGIITSASNSNVNRPSSPLDGTGHLENDLKHYTINSSTRWSDGTCATSDLLF